MDIEEIARNIVDSAIKIHREFGPGMLESAYQKCLAHELTRRGYKVVCEVVLPIKYEGEIIESGYRIDMCIEDGILIENKTVEKILPIHEAQLLTYLRLSKIRLGFILNWYSTLMKDGIKRMVI